MTHAERALLLEVAARMAQAEKLDDARYWSLQHLIAAVEAEATAEEAAPEDAAPEAPADAKSCETCSSYLFMYDKCLYPRDGECLPTHKYWQPRPTKAKSCETCRFSEGEDCTAGPGYCLPPSLKMWQPKPTEADVCPTCGGLGLVARSGDKYYSGNVKCPACDGEGKTK